MMIVRPTRRTAATVMMMIIGWSWISVGRSTAKLRDRIVAMMAHMMWWGNQQDGLQVERFSRARYAGRIRQIGIVHFALVHGALVHGLRLQAHVSSGQNEGQRGQDAAVHAACARGLKKT